MRFFMDVNAALKSAILAAPEVMQGLRKGAIVIIDRLHFSRYPCVRAGTTDYGDIRRPLIELPPGDLDAAIFEGQRPLALQAVSNSCTRAHATVVADLVVVLVE